MDLFKPFPNIKGVHTLFVKAYGYPKASLASREQLPLGTKHDPHHLRIVETMTIVVIPLNHQPNSLKPEQYSEYECEDWI